LDASEEVFLRDGRESTDVPGTTLPFAQVERQRVVETLYLATIKPY